MPYYDGFLLAVPTANKDAYRDHAASGASLFHEFGATRHMEAWGDDVPDGKLNDLKQAVKLEDGESVVFSWLEYPDKATRDAAVEKIMSDPRMEALGEMPFDGKRMIYAGFEPIVEDGAVSQPGYVDGYLLPVSPGKRDAYTAMAAKVAPLFREYGAQRVVEAWGSECPHGETTDFHRATHSQGDEEIVFSWIEWPSKEVRDTAWSRMMEDERMKPDGEMPFDGKRMMWGGFAPILDARA